MKILVIGNGGREHALAFKFCQSQLVSQVFSWPYSPASASQCSSLNISDSADHTTLVEAIKKIKIDFVVVGPEKHLAEGFADLCHQHQIPVFGPNKECAQLESSKSYSKALMTAAGIPTAQFKTFDDEESCRNYASARLLSEDGVVLKASGLAGGKGVFVCRSLDQIENACHHLYQTEMKGAASTVVVEDLLHGRECSFFALIRDNKATPLGFAVDFKRLRNHDEGPNTGGMGCYSPVPWLPQDAEDQVFAKVITPLMSELDKRALRYTGFLYVGLMWNQEHGPQVIEFNVRLGDPEAQVLAVRDQRDWGQLIAEQLGLVDQPESSISSTSQIQVGDQKAVCVVVTSPDYPFGEDTSYQDVEIPEGLFQNADGQCFIFGGAIGVNKARNLNPKKGRVLNIVGVDSDYHRARRTAYDMAERVKGFWPNCHFRLDIAQRMLQEEEADD